MHFLGMMENERSYLLSAPPVAPVNPSAQAAAKTYPYLELVCFPASSEIVTPLCGGFDVSEVDIAWEVG